MDLGQVDDFDRVATQFQRLTEIADERVPLESYIGFWPRSRSRPEGVAGNTAATVLVTGATGFVGRPARGSVACNGHPGRGGERPG